MLIVVCNQLDLVVVDILHWYNAFRFTTRCFPQKVDSRYIGILTNLVASTGRVLTRVLKSHEMKIMRRTLRSGVRETPVTSKQRALSLHVTRESGATASQALLH